MILSALNGLDMALPWLAQKIDDHLGVVTVIVGAFVFIVYRAQKTYEKSNAAKLILQEIRYAEQKVRNFNSHGTYNLNEKVLPTNNWNNNISLFVKELGETEIDQISDFFSSAARLDEVLTAVADFRNEQAIAPQGGPMDPGSGIRTATGSLPQAAEDLILAVSGDIGSLYNTPATARLREIADHKWYKKW
jgi:hypothetical protein